MMYVNLMRLCLLELLSGIVFIIMLYFFPLFVHSWLWKSGNIKEKFQELKLLPQPQRWLVSSIWVQC